MVDVFREVKRVLRDDGVVWLNYGDSYASSIKGDGGNQRGAKGGKPIAGQKFDPQKFNLDVPQGSLMMMPHRVALALQADGWIIRQDLVWSKSNPMPESLAGTRWVKHRIKEGRSKHAADHNIKGGTEAMLRDASIHTGINEDWVPEYVDCPGCEKCIPNDGLVLKRGSWRHTRSHEFIFQLVKGMQYFSNQEAVREGLQQSSIDRINQENFANQTGGEKDYKHGTNANRSMRKTLENFAESRAGRNPRSVLDVPTQPYKGSHYATFPVNLIAPLIRATCPRWACPVCGQGWAAVVEKADKPWDGDTRAHGRHEGTNSQKPTGQKMQDWLDANPDKVSAYRPTCEHPHTQEEAVPGIVFDPFVGSGTTVKVAQDLLRKGIGIDISMEYLDLQAKVRIGQGSPSNVLDDLPLFQ